MLRSISAAAAAPRALSGPPSPAAAIARRPHHGGGCRTTRSSSRPPLRTRFRVDDEDRYVGSDWGQQVPIIAEEPWDKVVRTVGGLKPRAFAAVAGGLVALYAANGASARLPCCAPRAAASCHRRRSSSEQAGQRMPPACACSCVSRGTRA
jgi:hypothetical protein